MNTVQHRLTHLAKNLCSFTARAKFSRQKVSAPKPQVYILAAPKSLSAEVYRRQNIDA